MTTTPRIWFTADSHFNHRNIIKYCKRPFDSVEDMDRTLINNWNLLVKAKDLVYHLGDFSMSHSIEKWTSYLSQLNGKIHLVLGNHDQEKVARKMLDKGLLESVAHYKYILSQGVRIILMHYAMRVWQGSHKGALHLHGHSHGNLAPWPRSMDVGVDVHDYRPISLTDVVKTLTPQKYEAVDHHGRV